jgi:hypothetical protein
LEKNILIIDRHRQTIELSTELGIKYTVWGYEQVCLAEMLKFSTNIISKLAYSGRYMVSGDQNSTKL